MKHMKKKHLLAALVLFFLSLVAPLQAAPSIPQPTRDFFVLDQANVLNPATEQTIVQNSAALAQKPRPRLW